MKKLLALLIVLGILVGGGYYGYAKVKSYAANKMVDEVAHHLTPQQIATLEKDPQVQAALKQSGSGSQPKLSKEQAIQMVEKKFTPSEIKDFVMMASGGFTTQEKAEIKKKVESRLTPKQMKELEAVAVEQLKHQ